MTALARMPLPVLVLLCALLIGPSAAPALQIKDQGTAGLDDKIVMSPAAERVQTVQIDGGELVAPGSVIRRPVIIHNRTRKTVQLDMSVAEVVGSSSELVVEVLHGQRGGAAAWAQLERPRLTLKSGQQGTMFVTIRVPKSVKPGSKPFAVTATQRAPQVQTEGAGIAPEFRQNAIFVVELPGDAPIEGRLTNAAVTSAQKGIAAAQKGERSPRNPRTYVSPSWTDKHRLTLSAEYENTGERLLKPRGRVVVTDLFGRTAGTYEIPDFTVYPGGEAAQIVELKGLPPLGIFSAKVQLESEEAGKQSTTLPRFALLPKWFLLALGAFLLHIAWRVVKWRLARRREWKQYMEQAEGEDAPAEHDDHDEHEHAAWDDDEAP